MYKKCKAAALLLALTLIITACGGDLAAAQPGSARQEGAEENTARPQIITTIFPQYDFVRQIAGDLADVSLLVTPGAESHSFEPTPRDMINLQNSDMFIYVGGESDKWVDKVVESLEMDSVTILTLMEMVETVEEEYVEGMQVDHDHDDHDEEGHDHDDEDDDHGGHDHSDAPELDEHVWTSPKNAILIVNQIASALCEIDPVNAADYTKNAQRYAEELAALDADFTQLIDNAPTKTVIFGDRFPFRYFADAYGLTYYAAFPGCSTDSDLNAGTLRFLIDKVTEDDIQYVFTIEFSTGKIADTICEATGAGRLELHSVHNVTRAELEAGESYLSLMRKNYDNLKEALYA